MCVLAVPWVRTPVLVIVDAFGNTCEKPRLPPAPLLQYIRVTYCFWETCGPARSKQVLASRTRCLNRVSGSKQWLTAEVTL